MKMRVALGIIDHRMENRWKELLHYPSDQIGDLRIVYDATELLEVSRMMVANLVIIELKLPGLQENKCIGQIRETNENCSFIAIGTGRNYDELLEAFENRMDAFLAEPLEKEDVCRTIERIAFETEMRQQEEISRQYRYAARQLFASKTYQMNTKHTDMATTNELMCTNFQPGYFQTILLCADFQGDRQTFLSYLPQLQKIWLSSIVDLIGDICFDILYDNSKEGLTLFLNYAEDKRLNI